MLVLPVVAFMASIQLGTALLFLSPLLLIYHTVLSQGRFSPRGLFRIAGLTYVWLRASRSAKAEATRPS